MRAAAMGLGQTLRRCRPLIGAMALWLTGATLAAACMQGPALETQMPDTRVFNPQSFVHPDGVITAAAFDAPTTRYPHGVLGDEVEAGALLVQVTDAGAEPGGCRSLRVDLPQNAVFEDVHPRILHIDGSGRGNILTVVSTDAGGASLVVYGLNADGTEVIQLGSTPPIGRPNRWLAPIGVADLDGDGHREIAYIDRPHLARTLRILRIEVADNGQIQMEEIAARTGLTNHRIGEDFISSGFHFCAGDGSWHILTANADWTRLMATRLHPDGTLDTRDAGPWPGPELSGANPC